MGRRLMQVVGLLVALLASTVPLTGLAQDAASGTPEASPAADPAHTLVIDTEQSFARYKVMEELQGTGDNEVIGETQAMLGTLLFDDSWMPLAGTRIDVDLRTLVTDSSRRDNYLYDNVLETGEFPLATFVVTGVEGLDSGLADGEETTFQLVGDLVIHGVTNMVTWDVTVTRTGDSITGFASTVIAIEDYDMEKPIVGPVVSIGDDITLEMDVVAVPADV